VATSCLGGKAIGIDMLRGVALAASRKIQESEVDRFKDTHRQPVRRKTMPLDRSVTRRCLGPGLDSGRKVLGEPLRRESRHFLESSWFLEQVSGSRNDD